VRSDSWQNLLPPIVVKAFKAVNDLNVGGRQKFMPATFYYIFHTKTFPYQIINYFCDLKTISNEKEGILNRCHGHNGMGWTSGVHAAFR
jgi:hypothetical protein